MAVISSRPALALRSPRLNRRVLAAAVVLVLLVSHLALRGRLPWPGALTFDLSGRMDRVYNWIVDNQDQSPLYVYFLNYISNFLTDLVRWLTHLLDWMSWIGVAATATLVTLRWGGRRVALLVLASCLAFGLLGVWTESMQTLALMAASVLVSLAIGVPLGVWAGLSDRVRALLTPVLDAMQIIPAFAYLMPVVILFSVGAPAAVIATVVYAVPPAVRITALGIRGVPDSAVEAAESLGATGRQVLFGVRLPYARRTIMLGVNQTIMMALSMVVIASLIGGAGLGDVVIGALTTLDVGQATIAGVAIVIMAIALDRSTAAAAARTDPTQRHVLPGQEQRERMLTLGALGTALVVAVVAHVAGARAFPQSFRLAGYVVDIGIRSSISSWLNSAVGWVQNPARFVQPITSRTGDAVVSWGLEPLRSLLAGTPWFIVLGAAVAIAMIVAGLRAAVTTALLLGLIGVIGVWPEAMDTASQVLISTVLTLIVGLAVGVWAGESPRVERLLRPFLDGLQTLPQFVYLIPVVALFNVGRVPGVIASILYASPVVIRLVTAGLRDVSPAAIEAASAFGASRRQLLLKVKVPLARPSIMLGVNQGIVMVLAVVIVAGLVGGGALGYGVVVGLQRNQFGSGVVSSIAILALGIVLDRITQTGVRGRATGRP